MAMIDIGIKIELAATAGATVPITTWRTLKDATAMPALIQPSSKISTDYIGDSFIGEILGKRQVTGLDFTFSYDGGAQNAQYRILADSADNTEKRWLRVTYPDGTKFILLIEGEVSLVAPAPSGELQYTWSVTPVKQNIGDLIIVVYPEEVDPTAPVEVDPTAPVEGGGD